MSKWHRNTRNMRRARPAFYEEGKLLDADPATRSEANCWICGERIDYDALPGSTEQSHELDHAIPVSERPDLQEDPSNFRHSHSICNRRRSNKAPLPSLGEAVPAWWPTG